MRKQLINLFMSVLLLIGGLTTTQAQTAAQYNFSASSGTYTPLSGGTVIPFTGTDEFYVNNIPIGFSFKFAGTDYNYVNVSTNGFLVLATASGANDLNSAKNNNGFANYNMYPCLAPLWDDLKLNDVTSSSYQLSGVSPNRVLTFEWKNMRWRFDASGPVISFQAKLYEGSNKIEYIYQQGASLVNAASATIGICSASGAFLTLNDAVASPRASSTVETVSISTKPATGQIYTFTTTAAPTTLAAGDVVIVAINGDVDAVNSYDRGFSFMPLVDLEAGTVINFTDYGWSDVTGAFITQNTIADAFIHYTAPTHITAGTIIRCDLYSNSNFTFDYSYAGSGNNFLNLAGLSSSDELLIFQGDRTSPTFIFAATFVTTGWATGVATTGVSSGSGSALPGSGNDLVADLVDDVTALSFNNTSTSNDNSAYSGPTTAATKADWLIRIQNYSNWTFNDIAPIPTPPIGPFTVNGTAVVPTVTAISPTSGTIVGGTTVTITGTNFTGATAVKFGATNATNFTVNSATQITATSPAGSGTVDVTVTTAGGTSATSSADQFTFVAIPTISTPNPATLSGFTSNFGSASTYQSFSISGSALQANIIVTAPTGFEISLSAATGYNSTLTLTKSGTSVAATTIYVRLKDTAYGSPSGNITLASTGATAQNVAVSGTVSQTPIEITSTSGTTEPVGYMTLGSAFNAINAGTHKGEITVKINTNTTESSTAALYQSGYNSTSSYTGVTIFPTTSGLTINGAITLNGADNVIINGSVNASNAANDLAIKANYEAITFINDASNNTVKYCTISGGNSGQFSGVISFKTAASTGNNSNLIDHNNITSFSDSNRPYMAIYTGGTAGAENKLDIISNNNIYNTLHLSGSDTYVIDISSNSTSWTIKGNSIYETSPQSSTNNAFNVGIMIRGDGHTVTDNYIGGSGPHCSGTFSFNAPQGRFFGIYLNLGSGTVSVQNNTIKNIDMTSFSWYGIYMVSGNGNIGTETGNIIGSGTGNGSINLTNNALDGATVYGIYNSGTGIVAIQNNSIGSVTTSGVGTGCLNFCGIYKSSSSGTNTISNNTIGSTDASTTNSIFTSSASTVSSQQLFGIKCEGNGNAIISGNTISKLTNGTTNTTVTSRGLTSGIFVAAGSCQILNNLVHDLTNANSNNSNSSYSSVTGISFANTTTAAQLISGNTIYNLSNSSATFGGSVIGLYYSGTTTASRVSGNYIYGLSVNAGSTAANLYGIKIDNGATTYSNNIISLSGNTLTNLYGIYENGSSDQNNNLYFNTVNIGGTQASGSQRSYALYSASNSNTRDFRNNIFMNARSTTGGGTLNYAVFFASYSGGSLTCDYNDYYASGTGGVLGYYNSADKTTLPIVTGVTGNDIHSLNSNPQFANSSGNLAADYLPANPNLAGVTGTGITTDYDGGAVRSLVYPAMGAFEYTVVQPAPTITSITPTSGTTAGGTSVVITGTNLTAASAVKFSSTNATSYTVNSATQITAVSPAGSGTVDITVTTAGGTSATSSADQFTYVVVPTVTGSAASNITTNSATLNGTVNANNASTVVTFEYGLTSSYGTSVTATQSPVTGNTATAVSCVLSGLVPNTTYHFRVNGVNTGGTTNGSDLTFTTAATVPTAITSAATSVTSTGATLNGSVNANNASTAVTFEYGLTTSYGTIVTAAQSPVTGTTATTVSYLLSGLVPNTMYHFRVKGVNTAGTTNGLDQTFTTTAVVPTVTTSSATGITSTIVTINGNINANNAATTVTFEYGLTTSYGNSATAIPSSVSGTTSTAVSSVLSGLTPNTIYHYRVVGVNTAGTSNGSDLTFTTATTVPTAITSAATSVTSTGATLNGSVNANNASTAVTFEYGLTTSYGTSVNAAQSPVTGSTATAVTSALIGLIEKTEYHFRVKAVNTAGTIYGDDFTFTTPAIVPTITSFTPASGIIGSSVTITGTNYSTTITDNEVYVGSLKATITACTATSITFTIPTGAVSGTIKVVLKNGEQALSDTNLVILGSPTFTSTPVTTVGYGQTYNYNIAATTEGSLTTTITAPTLPAWMTFSPGGQSSASLIGNIPSGVQICGVASDNNGNIFTITKDGTTIYKILPDGTTSVWRSGLLRKDVWELHIYDEYIYIPKVSDPSNSLTRIPLSDPMAEEVTMASVSGGIMSLANNGNYFFAADYTNNIIYKIDKSTKDKQVLLNNSNGIAGPNGLVSDAAGNLYIANYNDGRILKFDGTTVTTLLTGLTRPNSMRIDKDGNFYISFDNSGIRKYKPDFSSYVVVSNSASDNVQALSYNSNSSLVYSIFNSNQIYRLQTGASIQGTPAKSDVGPHNVVIRATNSAGYTEQAFTINVVDNVAAVVSTYSPATNATNIDLKHTLSLTFDEEVSLGSTGVMSIYNGATLVKSYDLSVAADKALFTLSSDKKTISVTPTENLPVNTVLSVGLDAGFVKDNYDNNFAGFTAASNTWQFTTVNKVTQTITYPAIDAKTYGDAAFTLGDATTDKGLTVTYTAADPTVVSIVGNQATILKAGNTKITATQTGDNVTFAATAVEQTLDVNKAVLTIAADNKSKVYDGLAFSNFTVTSTGFVKNETAAALTGSLAFSGTAVTAVNAGLNYVIKPEGLTSNNYTITFEDGELDITKRPITITIDAKSKMYGETDPILTAQITSGTILNTDVASGSLTRVAGETVADYAINKGTYTYGSNYDETFVSKNLSITKRPITITADAKSKTYGDTDPNLTAQITSGTIVTGDVATGLLTRIVGENVADYAINKGTYTYGSNYDETYVSKNLSITKRPITITADAKSKTYGDTDPNLTAQITSGTIVTGDVATGSLVRTVGEIVADYAINQGNYSYGSNYIETYVTAKMTIGQRPLAVTAVVDSKTYDGTAVSVGTPIIGTLLTGDVVNQAPTQVFDNANAGTGHVLTASGLTLKNNNANVTDNYNITYLASKATGVIHAKQLTISDPTVVTNKLADGNTTAAITTLGNLQGVETVDATSVGVSAVASYNSASVGNNKVITIVYTLTGNAMNNYLTPVSYLINDAKISGIIALSPLTNPTAGCEGSTLNLDYSVLSGIPTKYKLTFNAQAIAAGMLNVPYTSLSSNITNGNITIAIPQGVKDGTYQGTLVLSDDFGLESTGYNFGFTINASASLILNKFNKVVFIDNSSNRFTSFQWYKNGTEIAGAEKQFYIDPAGLVGAYSVKLKTTEGNILYTCEKVLNFPSPRKVVAYPNPVKSGQDCRIDVLGFADKDFDNAELIIFDVQGARVYQSSKLEVSNSVQLPYISGVYIGQFTTADGVKYMFKIIVTD